MEKLARLQSKRGHKESDIADPLGMCSRMHAHTHTHAQSNTDFTTNPGKKTEGANFFGTALSMIIHDYFCKIACLPQETQMMRRKIFVCSSL